MKVLSLTQPWASLVCLGAKRFETRSWESWYRGPLLIHASKSYPRWAKEAAEEEPFYSALRPNGVHSAPELVCGCIIGQVRLSACRRTELYRAKLSDMEFAFGDYADGRWMWKLDDAAFLPKPIPAKGALGLWEFDLKKHYSVVASEFAR